MLVPESSLDMALHMRKESNNVIGIGKKALEK
jgi:hypothetical protein